MVKRVVVAGASGLVGRAALRHFAALDGWEAIGVSRRDPAVPGARHLAVDLTDEAACREAFGALDAITHVVYAALYELPGLFAGWLAETQIETNGRMLRNLFDPLLAAAKGLEHVSLLHGTKAYGIHHPSIGPKGVRNPLREREPRKDHPNFYFVQEDYLRQRQRRASWGLTVWRPTVIYGDAWGANMNPLPVIGAWAALLKDSGEPLHFPGRPGHPVLREAVDADLVAHALAWAATEPRARDQTFNITNGDVFLWENVWPAIAEEFGMAPGEARPASLAEELPRRQAQWASLVERHALAAPRDLVAFLGMNSIVYTDMLLGGAATPSQPILNSTIHLRQAGFCECLDSEDMFRKWFRALRAERVLP